MQLNGLEYESLQAILRQKERAIAAVEKRIKEIERESAALLQPSVCEWDCAPRPCWSNPIPGATLHVERGSVTTSSQSIQPRHEEASLAPRKRAFIVDLQAESDALDPLCSQDVKILSGRLRAIGFTKIIHHLDVRLSPLDAILTSLLRFLEQSRPNDSIFAYLKGHCNTSSMTFHPKTERISFDDFASIFETNEIAGCQLLMVLDAHTPIELLQRMCPYVLIPTSYCNPSTKKPSRRIEGECCRLPQEEGDCTASQLARIDCPLFLIVKSCFDATALTDEEDDDSLFVRTLTSCLPRVKTSILDFHCSIVSEMSQMLRSPHLSDTRLPSLVFHEAFVPHRISCFSNEAILAPEKPSWLPDFSSSTSSSTRDISLISSRRMLRLSNLSVRLTMAEHLRDVVLRQIYLSLREWNPRESAEKRLQETQSQVRRPKIDHDEASAIFDDLIISDLEEDLSQFNFVIEVYGRGESPHFFRAAFAMLEGLLIRNGPLELILSSDQTTSVGVLECTLHLSLE